MEFGVGTFTGCGKDDSAHITSQCCIGTTIMQLFVSEMALSTLCSRASVSVIHATSSLHHVYFMYTCNNVP